MSPVAPSAFTRICHFSLADLKNKKKSLGVVTIFYSNKHMINWYYDNE